MAETAPAKKPKTVNGKVFSLVFRRDQMERLNKLLATSGLNRNQFFRLCAEKMTPSDIKNLQQR